MVRVLVVDDSLFMRTFIRDMLQSDPDIEVVGSAADGVSALQMISDLHPEVMTLDVEMPRMNGLELLSKKKSLPEFPRTIMLSSVTPKGGEVTQKAISLGADDFILKPASPGNTTAIRGELIAKIKNVVRIPYTMEKTGGEEGMARTVVVIGSSAGGPPMLDSILSSCNLPFRAATVIAQHMPEGGFTAALACRLDRISPMPVKESENGDLLKEGRVYVVKGGYHGIITGIVSPAGETGGKIIHSRSPPVHGVRPAADKTFSTASRVFQKNLISVLLSGMGNDGGEGTLAVKQQGGTTLVAREQDCLVYGMARSALSKNCVDRVLPLSTISREIYALLRKGPEALNV
jgi:two-component system chemotaxis response regulator CheB